VKEVGKVEMSRDSSLGGGASGGGCGSRFGCGCGSVSRVLAIVKWAGEGRQNTPPCQDLALEVMGEDQGVMIQTGMPLQYRVGCMVRFARITETEVTSDFHSYWNAL